MTRGSVPYRHLADGTRQHAALFVAVILAIVWGANFSITKVLIGQISTEALLFARYLVTPACAASLLLYCHGTHWPRLSKADWYSIAWLAIVGQLLHVSLITHGLAMSTAFSTAFISACGPVFSILIVALMGMERLGPPQLTGLVTALAGVVVFLWDKLGQGSWEQGVGDLVLLVATMLFSIYTVTARPVTQRCGAVVVMCYTTLLGSIPLLLINCKEGLAAPWASLAPLMWVGLAWSLAVASFVGWLAWAWVNSVRGVVRSAPLLYLLPPVAGLTSWIALGETFTVLKLAGAAIALCGVAIAQFGKPDS